MPPRAAKTNSNADKRTSQNLNVPCERLTRLRSKTLLANNSKNDKPQASNKTTITSKNANNSKPKRRRCISSSSSSSSKSESKNNADVDKGSISSSSVSTKFQSKEVTVNFNSSSEHVSSRIEDKMTFCSRTGIVWNRIATIFGDDALSKFQQANHMKSYKQFIWRCNLLALGNESKTECPYMMRVCQKKDKTSSIYYIYFSGVHDSVCKKLRYKLESQGNNLNKIVHIASIEKSGDEKQIQNNTKRNGNVNSSKKFSGQTLLDSSLFSDQNEIQKKKVRNEHSLIGMDISKSKNNMEGIKANSLSSATDEVPTLIIEHNSYNNSSSNNKKANDSLPHIGNNDENILLEFVDLNTTFPHLSTSTPIPSSVPINDLIDDDQNSNSSKTSIHPNSSPKMALASSEKNNKSIGSEKSTVETSPKVVVPKDWSFKLENISLQLKQLSEEFRLLFTMRGSNLAVFSSKEKSQAGQVLILTDQLGDDVFVKVSEYVDWDSNVYEMWPKASIRQFLYAVRGKLIEFFFVIPNDSISSGGESDGPSSSEINKITSEVFDVATSTSSNIEIKQEEEDSSSEGRSSGSNKRESMEFSIQPLIRKAT
ncbi:hypothetical protein Mgra_00008677 [Meloidogyne graminicola]|uniref:Uncharacterized protein n=1 Tax=Meloidogyne graminicola TaxID=189291 RepID=A0A8S9ZF17_9BILA|nr:hypothetical protein Mgra_00008677 [Meloidogyne graminicola]